MNEFLIVSFSLLGLVLLDAIGDAFRFRGWQIAHHIMEVFHVAGWVAVWALFGFIPVYIAMYISGRILLFDIAFNLTAGLPITYIGKNSIYDIVLSWFASIPAIAQHPGNLVFIFRFIAFLFWIGLFIKNL